MDLDWPVRRFDASRPSLGPDHSPGMNDDWLELLQALSTEARFPVVGAHACVEAPTMRPAGSRASTVSPTREQGSHISDRARAHRAPTSRATS